MSEDVEIDSPGRLIALVVWYETKDQTHKIQYKGRVINDVPKLGHEREDFGLEDFALIRVELEGTTKVSS